jgi:hypothetical protein
VAISRDCFVVILLAMTFISAEESGQGMALKIFM